MQNINLVLEDLKGNNIIDYDLSFMKWTKWELLIVPLNVCYLIAFIDEVQFYYIRTIMLTFYMSPFNSPNQPLNSKKI